jgi:hypothetical protein
MRRLAALGMAMLGVAMLAGPSVATDNQAPVAFDDPTTPGCLPIDAWGGAFPVYEDSVEQVPGVGTGWTVVFGACSPLANDSDPDGDPLSLVLQDQPAHGGAIWYPEGFLAYDPDPDWSTPRGDETGGTWISDEIHYRVSDGQALSDVASYRIWIQPINDPPTFTPGAESVEARIGDGPVSVPWATDISPGPANEGAQSVTFEVDADVTGAPDMFATSPTIDGDGVLHFTPGSEPGLAQVTVHARDDGGVDRYGAAAGTITPPDDTSADVTFSIVVREPLPSPPVAVDDELVLDEDTSRSIGPLENDSDPNREPLSLREIGPAAHGTAEIVFGTGVLYTPEPDANGTDSFSYTVGDPTGSTDTGTVHVTINPVNDAPLAQDDAAMAVESTTIVVPVLANDDDIDGDALTVSTVGTPAHGSASVDAVGVRYVPQSGFLGSDEVSYTVSDGAGGSDTAVLRVTVVSDTVPPVIGSLGRSLPVQTVDGNAVTVRLAWSASDAGSGVASYQLQERVGAGSWHGVGLGSAVSRSATRTTSIGTTYRYRVRATDHQGNTGAWKEWAAFAPRRAQETSANIRWSGAWSSASDSRFSGGAARRTSSGGRVATYTFTGRDIGWVTARSTVGGRAEVRIDGVLVRTIDVDSTATGFRRMLFTAHLASGGTHRIEIGPKGDGRVTVDAFVVLP